MLLIAGQLLIPKSQLPAARPDSLSADHTDEAQKAASTGQSGKSQWFNGSLLAY